MNIMCFLINYGKAGLISWGAYFVIGFVYALVKAWHIDRIMGTAYAHRFVDAFYSEAVSLTHYTLLQVAITRTILFPWGIYDATNIVEEALHRANAKITQQFEEEKGAV